MKQWKTITPYIATLCLTSVMLTGCGGEYDITTGKGGGASGSAISGGAVSGSAVSDGAINETEEKKVDKVDEKNQTSLEQRFLQEMYPYRNSKFAYTEGDGKIWQVSLTDGEKQQESSVPGMEFDGKYDEEKHPWLKVLYVSDDEIVYEVTSFLDVGGVSTEIWSVPLRKQGEKEYLDGSQGEKILTVKDLITIVYVDENYIAFEDKGYHEYDRKRKKYMLGDWDQKEMVWTVNEGDIPNDKYRKEMLLAVYENSSAVQTRTYYHKVGSETMELVLENVDESEIGYGLAMDEEGIAKKIYYINDVDDCLYCYDAKNKKTECVVSEKEKKQIMGKGATLDFLYGEHDKVYLEFLTDNEEYIYCSYTEENGLQEEKELSEFLNKRQGEMLVLSERYAGIQTDLRGDKDTYTIYDMRTGKSEKVKNICLKNWLEY